MQPIAASVTNCGDRVERAKRFRLGFHIKIDGEIFLVPWSVETGLEIKIDVNR